MYKRHGDIPVFKWKGSVKGEVVKHNGSVPIAFGETTGHKHLLSVSNPNDLTIVKTTAGYIFTLKTEGKLSHEEHGTLTLAAGTYRSAHQREKDWFSLATRRVID